MRKLFSGFSLIEMLITVGIFSILAVIVTQSLASSLKGARKSDNIGRVRENVEYAMNYIERNLRGAKRLDFDDNPVGGVDDRCGVNNSIYFYNNRGVSENILLNGTRLQHNGQDITSSNIQVTSILVSCLPGAGGEPDSISITVSASDSAVTGTAESATYTAVTQITLRNYSRN